VVDARDGGLAELTIAGEGSGTDAIVVVLIDRFSEGLGTVATA
jgi:hypothetical protein